MLERIVASYLVMAVLTFLYSSIIIFIELPKPETREDIRKVLEKVRDKYPENPILENESIVRILIIIGLIFSAFENGCIWPRFVYNTTIKCVIEKVTKKD